MSPITGPMVVYPPADRCPRCGAVIWDHPRTTLEESRPGRRGGVNRYVCGECRLEFWMYLPGLTKRLLAKAKMVAKRLSEI